ncbi:hypothetical protein [Pedobacter sp. Leaf194]|uniref:hypothetical protein n=1 Tax=Pedobacter sp. Leaf194 TaxID=1736297 RepID=UPI000702C4BC|nr:hypothetical protein [Pedobacter sp. Leaf194]KQS41750.1 hypothetical protein ASG14_04685 [Pedobacter sp. Leaf194]
MIHGKYIVEPDETIVTDLNSQYTFTIAPDVRLDKIFDAIPSNSIINKGRCGIGGTYLEIKADRNSIIVIPTNAVIDSKCFDSTGNLLENHYVVRGKVEDFNFAELREFMSDDTSFKKIFCTPESLGKIAKSGYPLELLHNQWFILFDESHSTITDAYRKNMLLAFEYFFQFKYKSMISATPYRFSDARIQAFDSYTIRFNDFIGSIEIKSTPYVIALLHTILTSPDHFPSRVHIFLNSVKGIANAIRMANLKDCAIFCKDDTKNMNELDELRGYFKAKPEQDSFSKYNFYTTKYFEGWDLEDKNATLIVISDVNQLTLRSGISNKCVQALGRNRSKSHRLIHITNDRAVKVFTHFEDIEESTFRTAEDVINHYNAHIHNSTNNDFPADEDIERSVEKYCDKVTSTKEVTLSHFKVDRIINGNYCNQEYNHLDYIRQAWEKSHYKVTISKNYVPKIPEIPLRMKESHKVKLMVEYLDELHNNSENVENYSSMQDFLPRDLGYIIEYYNELGSDVMKRYNFNINQMRDLFRKSRNNEAMQYVAEEYFKTHRNANVSTSRASDTLQNLYVKFGVMKTKGAIETPKKASASQLQTIFKEVKRTKVDKKYVWRIEEK